MNKKRLIVVNGGQSGVERAALVSAMSFAISFGGWIPKGRRADDGVVPAGFYAMKELPNEDFNECTVANMRDSDATLVLVNKLPPSGKAAYVAEKATELCKPCKIVDVDDVNAKRDITNWMISLEDMPGITHSVKLHITGSLESEAPGIFEKVGRIFGIVFWDFRAYSGGDVISVDEKGELCGFVCDDVVEELFTEAVKRHHQKKILYLHGLASSGSSGTVELLRDAFWDDDASKRSIVIAPDLPVDPKEALPMIKEIVRLEKPSLIIGTSMGGLYAQQIHGVNRICVNPSFTLSKKTDILHVGVHEWFNRRKDGMTEFEVTQAIVDNFAAMEARQFDGCTSDDSKKCFALFGDEDAIGLPCKDMFESHYPGMSRIFHGGHRMNADVVRHVLIPFIKESDWFNV